MQKSKPITDNKDLTEMNRVPEERKKDLKKWKRL
jgi:hypothetical protein